MRGVAGCRVVTDASGNLTELHVVSTGQRPPKFLVRDIQTVLLVRLNYSIPHRRISVALLRDAGRVEEAAMQQTPGPPAAGPAPAQATGTEAAAGAQAGAAARAGPPAQPARPEQPGEQPAVLQLERVTLRYEGSQVRAEVELTSLGQPRWASLAGPDEGMAAALLGARTVLAALAGDPAWEGVYLQWVDLAGVSAAPVVVVSVARTVAASAEGGPTTWECVAARPERGNVTLAAAAATAEALVKLLSLARGAV